MLPDYINLTLDLRLPGLSPQGIRVYERLPLAELLALIKDRFNLDHELVIRPVEAIPPLRLDLTLRDAGLQEGDTLICEPALTTSDTATRIAAGVRQPFSQPFQRVYFQDQTTLAEYDLSWQPAIIGRLDHYRLERNHLLAINLEAEDGLPVVSRQHACITEQAGSFFLEALQDRNPVRLNGLRLRPFVQYPLPAGATVRLGPRTLTFQFVSG